LFQSEEDENQETVEDSPQTKRRKLEESSLAARTQHLSTLNNEIEQMEQELLESKHWSLTGETGSKKRERNSLLELNLDLPMSYFQSKRAVDEAIAMGTLGQDGNGGLGF